jgi:hypothetical protein
MQDTKTLLTQSIDQYQAILHELKDMSNRLAKDRTDSITEGCDHLVELQALAKQIDETILAKLNQRSVQDALLPILKRRQLLIEEIVNQNELLFSQITGKMGLINKELLDIKSGMTGISGYRFSPAQTGNIINRAS